MSQFGLSSFTTLVETAISKQKQDSSCSSVHATKGNEIVHAQKNRLTSDELVFNYWRGKQLRTGA